LNAKVETIAGSEKMWAKQWIVVFYDEGIADTGVEINQGLVPFGKHISR